MIEFDEDSLYYYRFITHLKFFAQRLLNNTHYDDDNKDLLEVIKYKHKKPFQCVEKIKFFIAEKYQYDLSDEEMLYLAVHIARIVKKL
jgi:Transcriptional antiterminator